MPTAWHPGQLLFAGFEGTELPPDLGELLAAGRIGGAVLFARNVRDPRQLRALVDDLHAAAPEDRPITVAVDQEGGRVQRLRSPWTEWPPMRRLGERDRADETRQVARAIARELADLRIDLDFAPVVDVDTNPRNPVIGDRSFAGSPDAVSRHAVAFIEGLQGEGIAACAKHFPGHGDADADSHVELPTIDCDVERLRRVELPPFRAAIEAGVACLMTAHVRVPCLDAEAPATLSPAVMELLRGEIGYDGLVFGDDLEMAAVADRYAPGDVARLALEAGVDALLVCSRSDMRKEVLDALEALPDALLENAARRMEGFKRRFSGGRHATGDGAPYSQHVALVRDLV